MFLLICFYFHSQNVLSRACGSSCTTFLLQCIEFFIMLVDKSIQGYSMSSIMAPTNELTYSSIRGLIWSSVSGSPPFLRIASWKNAVRTTTRTISIPWISHEIKGNVLWGWPCFLRAVPTLCSFASLIPARRNFWLSSGGQQHDKT